MVMASQGQIFMQRVQPVQTSVLMDVLMPVVQGGEALRYLRNQDGLEKTRIVLMSSLTPETFDRIWANRLEADAYMQKPLSMDSICRKTGELIGSGTGR